ncbi:MAG: Fic family protein [Candidatus Cloacimonetes bacterium]|nr:Fic family protein [Candidatus Cloacimonadota bacterium]
MINKKWIWTNKRYPEFFYDIHILNPILLDIKYHQGLLDGIFRNISSEDIDQINLNLLAIDAIDTSAIEGNILNRDSVRSSIAKKLAISIEGNDSSTIHTNGLIEFLLDAIINNQKQVTLERIFGWHNCLFPTGYSGLQKIDVAQLRGPDEMQIVSGSYIKESVHYIAPPRSRLDEEMTRFIDWINNDSDLSIIKAGIAHLWFVIIHPLDDGNGRIARALSDLILTKEAKAVIKLYSVSSAIKHDIKNYYSILEKTTASESLDITLWLQWFLNTMLKSLKESLKSVQYVIDKTAFWNLHKNTVLNARQKKLLNKLLDMGVDNFEGSINTRKYAAITKTSKITASRELKDLVDKNCIIQCKGTAGRNTSYEILLCD